MPDEALVGRLEPGDHICWTFMDDADRDRVLAEYVRVGLPLDHKVIYFPHATTPERTLAALEDAGLDVPALTAAGRLEVHGAREAYLGSGRFDPAAMVAGCLDACARARAEGYAGLRLAGDMSWAAEPVAGVEALSWYEAQVNQVYAGGYAMGLCLYDGRLFPRTRMSPVLAAHPGSVDPGTDAGWSPLLRIRRTVGSPGLKLEGATDLSNRGSLVALLEALEPGDGHLPPVLDVTALSFVDVPTAHSIIVAAARLGGLRVVGASAHLAQVLEFVGAGCLPGLMIDQGATCRVTA